MRGQNDLFEKLNKLLKRADQIEAMGVKYETPEEFLDAFATEDAEETDEDEPE